MRSQLLICLENFRGIVIFATNFVESYDKAFRSRVRDIFFPQPDYACRVQIWRRHLPQELPLEADVVPEDLAKEDINGRDIKNVVIDSALRAAADGAIVKLQYVKDAIARLRASKADARNLETDILSEEETEELTDKVRDSLSNQ